MRSTFKRGAGRGALAAVAVAAATVAAPAGASGLGAPDARAAARRADAEIVIAGRWRNSTLAALRRTYGRQVRFRRVGRDGRALQLLRRLNRRDAGRADARAVVLDLRTRRAAALRRSRLVAHALEAGNWVIALNATAGKRGAAFARRIGSKTPGRTTVTAVRVGTDRGRPDIHVVNVLAPPLRRAPRRARRVVTRAYARRLHRALVARRRARAAAEEPVPDSLLTARWTITTVGSAALAWPDRNSAVPKGDSWRRQRQQPVLSATQTFTAYLSNQNMVTPGGVDPTAARQYVYYELDGTVSPIADPTRHNLFFRDPLAPDWQDNRGWWTAGVDATIRPPAGLRLRRSAPVTPNAVSQYTSGTSFTIGFTASAAKQTGVARGSNIGAAVNASWTYNDTVTREIPDWGVRSRVTGDVAAWRFYSKSPCDYSGGVGTIVANEGPQRCFAGRGTGLLWNHQKPKAVNELSAGTMDFHANALWQSDRLITGPVTFEPTLEATMAWTWWGGINRDKHPERSWFARKCPLRCSMVQTTRIDGLGDPGGRERHGRVTLDLGAVVPVGIEALTFHERPGGPALDVSEPLWIGDANHRTVHACVRLAGPAPATLRLPVGSTNLENFFAGGTIAIPYGDRGACFPVNLTANRLARCEAITAEIGAFYAAPYTVPLTVRSGAPERCREAAGA